MVRAFTFLLAAFTLACASAEPLPVLNQLEPTVLTDQTGAAVDLADLKGTVWVAHFMFTRCEGPCPRMVAEFRSLQRELGVMPGVRWVSISADPTYDTPAVLAAYAKKFEADPATWSFLTGDTAQIYTLAEKGFLLPAEPATDGGLITHSLKMAVVDKALRVRAFHSHFEDGTAQALAPELAALTEESP